MKSLFFCLQDPGAKKWRQKLLFLSENCGRRSKAIVTDSITISSTRTQVTSSVQEEFTRMFPLNFYNNLYNYLISIINKWNTSSLNSDHYLCIFIDTLYTKYTRSMWWLYFFLDGKVQNILCGGIVNILENSYLKLSNHWWSNERLSPILVLIPFLP